MSNFSKESQENDAERSGYFYHKIIQKDAEIQSLKNLIGELVNALKARHQLYDSQMYGQLVNDLIQRSREATK